VATHEDDGAVNAVSSPARADRELRELNRRFYDSLRTDARLVEPERFNTWPLVRSLAAQARHRLEVAPGLRPRHPIGGRTSWISASRRLRNCVDVRRASPLTRYRSCRLPTPCSTLCAPSTSSSTSMMTIARCRSYPAFAHPAGIPPFRPSASIALDGVR